VTNRQVEKLITTRAVTEGAGVTVHRTIGTPALRNLDPFLMLDHFSSDDPDDYIAGFPDHPHRGFITLTYMLDGHMLHQDSMGNRGDLKSGGAQWMKAASGVIHSEMPQQTAGLMRGFQLWINLPAREKMTAPAYQEYSPDAIPLYNGDGLRVRVLSGQYQEINGPIDDPHTDVHYFDVTLDPAHTFSHHLASNMQAFIYVFEGEAIVESSALSQQSFALLGPGKHIQVSAEADGARFILVAGQPIGEPIVQYGPFVMSSAAEIQQALADYRDGKLVQHKAAFITD
jgi:redox-sensitive bicupin YhaK (pirin superfamily)